MAGLSLTSRRAMLKTTAAGLGAVALGLKGTALAKLVQTDQKQFKLLEKHLVPLRLKGRIRQSAARWCYNSVSFADLCKAAKALGLAGIDLADKKDWDTLKTHGLQATMVYGAGNIPDAFNRVENHDRLVGDFRENGALASKYGWQNVITFSGNRKGLPDNEGLRNTVVGLNRIKPLAEELNLTVHLELLNSKVNHKDYQFDHIGWGVEVIKQVNSPRIKILYDIYHAQIMDGDIIRTIRDNIQFIGHFHTGGVPGRHELDETQELNWRTVMRAIADLDYRGFVAHEFVPIKSDPLDSLREAVILSDV